MGSFECINTLQGLLRGGEFLDYLCDSTFQKGLCFMELLQQQQQHHHHHPFIQVFRC
jgi:hypothetical protein